ncbi:MAG: hypothetical protein GY756_14330, partial [bacterium]|nr:hypothetical protein [bacterium]
MNKEWETLGLGDSHFHSNREERHILGGKTGKKEKKGFFQKNPGMKIVLLDILFII